jgi:hypothetical protein
VSFLNQLKSQASALQTQQMGQQQNLQANIEATELACQTVWLYMVELSKQLNVIQPAGPKLSLDGRTPWPAMKLIDFRADCRKKKLLDKDVHDYISVAWQIVPQVDAVVAGAVSVNFPPDLERVEKRLACGGVKFERKDVRHPEKNTLQAIRFEYQTQARGYLMMTAEHDKAQLAFRLTNTGGFEVLNASWPAARIQTDLLDELAKLVVGEPSNFL